MTLAVIQTQASDSQTAWQGQDMLLALASMDLNPQLILTGHGIDLWLHDGNSQQNNRSLHKRYAMLELFDCPAPWVHEDEMTARGLSEDDFIAAIEVLDVDTWQAKLSQLTKVLTY
jgi:sulfur relay (sulfurtransferase) DsrF/TusC family protein